MEALLSPYRILDLTEQQGWLCGKLLGDLGADVIKIERPQGDPARMAGPFYQDRVDPEKSLSWFAFNTSKRGITLNLERKEGRALFKELVKKADGVIHSFPPGFMEEAGLAYEDLCEVKSDLVFTSITPFGETGPFRDFKATDLTLWALSGLLYICGDPDRPPVRISLPQSSLHAGVDGATGMIMALYFRGLTGEGQKVEVSVQKSLERVAYTSRTTWDGRKKLLRRPGSALRMPPLGTSTPLIWSCKDGNVAFYLFGGTMGAISNPALVQWMDEQGMATDFLKKVDWPKLDIGRTPQGEMDLIVGLIAGFFAVHTKDELWREGVKRRVMVYPVANAKDILSDSQLLERGFWVELEHPELKDSLIYPGSFVKTADGLCRPRQRAPRIGEHNSEIFEQELGLSPAEMERLRQAGVI